MVIRLYSFLLVASVAATTVTVQEDKLEEICAAMIVSQLTLSQHSLALQELLNTTRSSTSDASSSSDASSTTERSCPPPYTKMLDECFYLSQNALDWHQARQFCFGLAGDLATPARVTAVLAYIHGQQIHDGRVWLGVTDAEEEGVWRWLDETPILTSDWAELQPNNFGRSQHCLNLLVDAYPPLNDDKCPDDYKFVCQYKRHN